MSSNICRRQSSEERLRSEKKIETSRHIDDLRTILGALKSFPPLSTVNDEALQSSLEAILDAFGTIQGYIYSMPEELIVLLKAVLDLRDPSPCSKTLALACKILIFCSKTYIDRMLSFFIEKSVIELLILESDGNRLGSPGSIAAVSLLATLLPWLPRSMRTKELDEIWPDILFKGRCLTGWNSSNDKKVDRVFLQSLNPLLDICLKGEKREREDIPLSFHLLLFKAFYWSCKTESSKPLFDVESQLSLIETLLTDDNKDKVKIGMAIVFTSLEILLSENSYKDKIRELFDYARPKVTTLSRVHNHPWIASLYAIFDCEDQTIIRETVESLLEFEDSDDYPSRRKTIRSIVEFLTPFRTFGDKRFINFHYSRLIAFLEVVLDLPKDAGGRKERPKVNRKGVESFGRLVSHVVETVNYVLQERIHYVNVNEILRFFSRNPAKSPTCPLDVDLSLYTSKTLDGCLGQEKEVMEALGERILPLTLKVVSILYAVNENWGVVFCTLSTETLVDRELFVSRTMDCMLSRDMDKIVRDSRPHFSSHVASLTWHPFLVPFETRRKLFDAYKKFRYRHLDTKETANFNASRRNVVETVVAKMEQLRAADRRWEFSFEGEEGRGRGPTKEFYAEVSKDLQRHDLGLWIGESVTSPDGVRYVHNPSGLFPLPSCLASTESEDKLAVLARMMSKSCVDDFRMDINLSRAFYKGLLGEGDSCQCPTLVDIKDVLPYLTGFLADLVDCLREKCNIEKDVSMTMKEKREAISKITCNGCPFEDLCIDFTLPGFPDLEMVVEGKKKFLDIDNVEEYLKFLVWTLLYGGMRPSVKTFQNDFFTFFQDFYIRLFHPHEMEKLFCGVREEKWTLEYLEQSCQLEEGYTVDTPLIRRLFKVLSSLTAAEQSRFLQFVTGSPRLPAGGLMSLTPKLTVMCDDEEPDTLLPSSMTCHNVLVVSEYSSTEILRSKLMTAITEGANSFGFI